MKELDNKQEPTSILSHKVIGEASQSVSTTSTKKVTLIENDKVDKTMPKKIKKKDRFQKRRAI